MAGVSAGDERGYVRPDKLSPESRTLLPARRSVGKSRVEVTPPSPTSVPLLHASATLRTIYVLRNVQTTIQMPWGTRAARQRSDVVRTDH